MDSSTAPMQLDSPPPVAPSAAAAGNSVSNSEAQHEKVYANKSRTVSKHRASMRI